VFIIKTLAFVPWIDYYSLPNLVKNFPEITLHVLGVREDLSDKNFALSKFDFRDDAQFFSTNIENVLIADLIDAGKRRPRCGAGSVVRGLFGRVAAGQLAIKMSS
jgi:hypothetical protein